MSTTRERRALPDEEYLARARAPGRRLTVPLLTVLVIGIGVAFAAVMAVRSTHSVQATVTAYHTTDRGIRLTVDVTHPDRDRGLVCVLRALDRNHSVLGTARVAVRGGERETSFTRTIRTSSRPVAGDVKSCQYR